MPTEQSNAWRLQDLDQNPQQFQPIWKSDPANDDGWSGLDHSRSLAHLPTRYKMISLKSQQQRHTILRNVYFAQKTHASRDTLVAAQQRYTDYVRIYTGTEPVWKRGMICIRPMSFAISACEVFEY